MKYAPASLPDGPAGGVTAGIDWASEDHAVCVVDAAGEVVTRFAVEHAAAGLRDLVQRLARVGVGEVPMERGDGPVVDALLGAGLTVVVITPGQVKNLRSRYRSAGNKDDRFDAYVLGDVLRTDRARLRPLVPDRPETVLLRQACRARKDLVWHRVAVGNQLRAHLLIVLPGAAGLFSRIDSAISLAFLNRFGCQDQADWLKTAAYSGRTSPAELYRRLASAPHGRSGTGAATVTRALTAVLASLNTQIKTLDAQIAAQLASHADGHIFTSLPRSGTVRAARLLTEIGDCLARFPDPASLICLAGAAPSTRQSGKHKAATFRWAVSKQLRDAVCNFADGSPPRPSLGRPDLPRRHRPRQRPPARDPDPRPGMALRDLALLARRRPLRPPMPQSPAAPPRRGPNSGSLTQGYSFTHGQKGSSRTRSRPVSLVAHDDG
jgi:transposase